MKTIKTPIPDLLIIEPSVFKDSRGYFFESYNSAKLTEIGLRYHFVQDNQSKSTRGTMRGLHFQYGKMAQAKLVSVVSGCVWDVAIDLRQDSPTYKKNFALELSDQNFRQLLIPRGFAHGFICLSETAVFSYKCDNFYEKSADGGIRYDDPTLAIPWPIGTNELLISEKDASLPYLSEIEAKLCF